MDNITEVSPNKELPFNNLYWLAGWVTGYNALWMYALTLLLVIIGYIGFGSLLTIPLVTKALENGISLAQLTEDSSLLFDSEIVKLDRNIILLTQFHNFQWDFTIFRINLYLCIWYL